MLIAVVRHYHLKLPTAVVRRQLAWQNRAKVHYKTATVDRENFVAKISFVVAVNHENLTHEILQEILTAKSNNITVSKICMCELNCAEHCLSLNFGPSAIHQHVNGLPDPKGSLSLHSFMRYCLSESGGLKSTS